MSASSEYTDALRDLDRLHREGRIDQATYELHRSKLLAEAARPVRPLAVRLTLFVVIVLALLVLLRIVLGAS